MIPVSLALVAACQIAAPTPALSLGFGHAPADLGLARESEASPEGPGSLAVDEEGHVWLLDAVHQRIAVFAKSDELVGNVPLLSATVEDFALLPSGDVAVLDRLVERRVTVLAPNGAVIARAEVEGPGVEEGGLVTAVFADQTGVWLEVLHGMQVRVIDELARPDANRPTRPGLPFGDRFVRLRKVGNAAQVLFFHLDGRLVGDQAVSFGPLLELSGLVVHKDSLFVAGHELVQQGLNRKPSRDAIVVVELAVHEDRLLERARRDFPASPEFVPLKQLVTAGATGVAHLFVDTTSQQGRSVEVTSW